MKKKISAFLFILLFVLQSICVADNKMVYGEIWEYRIYKDGSKAGLMRDNEIIIDAAYDDIIPFRGITDNHPWSEQQAFYTVQEGKKGAILLNDDGVVSTIPALYDNVDYNSSDETWVVKLDQLYGAYNQEGKMIIPVICQDYPYIFDNVYVLSDKAPCSFYSLANNNTYYVNWDEIHVFMDGRSLVRSGDKYGFINAQNECVIPCIYKEGSSFSEGIAWVMDEKGLLFAINTEGNILFSLSDCKNAYPFQEGIAWVENSLGQYYAVNTDGKTLFQVDGIPERDFTKWGGSLISEASGQYSLINKEGKYLPKQNAYYCDNPEFDSHGCFIASDNDEMWGLINSSGRIIVPFICDWDFHWQLSIFNETVIARDCRETGLYRVYDVNGAELCSFYCDPSYEPDYEEGWFSDDLELIALSEEERCYIDKTGKVIIPSSTELYYLSDFSEGLARIAVDEKCGYMDKSGKVVIETKYDSVSDFYNQFAVVTEDGKEKYINHNGEVIYEKP